MFPMHKLRCDVWTIRFEWSIVIPQDFETGKRLLIDVHKVLLSGAQLAKFPFGRAFCQPFPNAPW